MTELLAPAGNFEKLKAALRFGADAVYLGGKRFGMRSAADNFDTAELTEAVAYTHERGKKCYVTVNTLPHADEYPALRAYIEELKTIGPDGLIVTDLGVLATVRELWPAAEIHISTQASIVSPAAARAYAALGAERLVLARELTLDEVKAIHAAVPDVTLEAFVHGSMCVAYSGRCMLSNALAGRDANRGACAQPCRWNYAIVEETRPDELMPIEQNEQGTFIMSSKDMCAIRHLPELIKAGVSAFKIEGRVKSAYYAAAVTNAYRMALDAYQKDPAHYVFDEAWYREVESVSHRAYCTGFWFGKPTDDPQLCEKPGYIREKAYLATVAQSRAVLPGVLTETDDGVLCRMIQRNKLARGEAVELLTPGHVGVPLAANELYDEAGAPLESTPHPLMTYYMRLPNGAGEGDILRAGNAG